MTPKPRNRADRWGRRAAVAGGVILIALKTVVPAEARTSGSMADPTTSTQSASKTAGLPVAVGASLERVGATTRLTFDLSRATSVSAYTLENPDRIIVETPEINFQLGPDIGRHKAEPGGLVRSFRFGQFVPGRSRIVIDLAEPAKVVKLDVAAIAGGDPSRLAIQLQRCDRASFHESAAKHAPEEPTVLPIAPLRADLGGAETRPVVVIDPGHGGIDPGASGIGGVQEKRIVFDFASAVADKLAATGLYKVVMTRSGDSFVSLGDRVRIARESKASLFVSVHADTLSSASDVAGATVYTASDKASDAEAARVADSENRADEDAGLEATTDATDVSDILFDLTRRETRTFSHAFQRTLAGYWQKIAKLNKNPERSAGFRVLRAPDVPSVLLELGYLSSEKDVAALTSGEWRDRASAGVVASINSFFAARSPTERTASGQVDARGSDPDRSAIVVLRPHL